MPLNCSNHILIYILFQPSSSLSKLHLVCADYLGFSDFICVPFLSTTLFFFLLLETKIICCITEFGHGLWTLNCNWNLNIWFDCKPFISSLSFTIFYLSIFCSSYGCYTRLIMDNWISVVSYLAVNRMT